MNASPNPLELFQQEAPEVASAFTALVRSLEARPTLNTKTKQLIYIGIKAVLGDQKAVYFHVPMAKKAGATRDEIKDTILISLTVCGLRAVAEILPLALEVYDRVDQFD
ncbi:MAG: carboxymuconolactone decarboxylase family protein [Candidatus Pseudobacter hemicellulosilyticus]|uniref:Carboxymuconolactone decarboxylase family protein n=1 Tax=Candidatus Pseudobacter hemicellulosilyticus TaxID=3121375 RepID=A0AAJ6BHW9_9BACT|nr:MAG: carboxymuconolactone decarboxylase family protein [Pseudobacter sp.]